MGSIISKDSDDTHAFHSPGTSEGRSLLGRHYYHHHDYGGSHTPRPFPTAPVTELVKEARYAIINALDTSLTRDELGSPEIYLALLLPIVRKYREERKETAAVYGFLLNRWQFLKDAESDLANARLNETRAHACEIVATKVLKAFSMRQLIDVLTYDFSPIRHQIWLGNIVFFATAIDHPDTSLNASHQEIRTVTVYDSRQIKFLRLSRLRVPRYKTTFQMVSFAAFILVYTVVTFAKEAKLTAVEVIMDVFALSYTLDEFLQLKDSGPSFYFETVWNLFDVPIYICFLVFMGLRISTFFTNSADMSFFAYDVLACNAILLWPRLFAALDHYRFFGTMLIVLRQMLLDAMLFLALSFIFYVGFLQAFYGLHDNTKSYGDIAWLLLQVFFGSAFLGFEEASELSELFGAPLMVLFVAISVLMLYTLLISIFSQTFSEVSANAKEEFMFLFSVKVMEEVKSDALYEFQPPFNIMAGILVWPCSFVYDSIVVGKLSRVLLRFFYFPELICIWIFEVLILQKQPQYMPVRPGHVDHSGTYGSTTLPAQTIGGGVAKRRHETTSAAANSMTVSDSATASHNVGEFAVDLNTDSLISTSRDDPEGVQQGATATTDPQKFNRIDTNTQTLPDDPQPHELISPYFENIRRFRDSNDNSASSSSVSMKSEGDHPPVNCYNPSVYSFHPAAPIGMGGGVGRLRQGSISGYQRYRHGTDATLSNTFQGVWPSYDQGSILANGPGHGHGYQTTGRSGPVDTRWFDDEYKADDEVTRLIEARFAEMRTRMEEIDTKLDRLMKAILVANHDVSE
ncbi:hypothetical protein BG006_001544 [Podila minutissima]|uniref:Ion transport domain-containing protein n=1 Tax=Podila minutissima TaxID=64525 RepID=A0A9P5SA69_9FUNG|nr:hypothetical protein BG006_001544 [Podila minutissima]